MQRTLWHRLLGKLWEIVLTPAGVTVLSELQVTSNPPQVDILLLRREGADWTLEQMNLLPDGVRDRRVAHHLFECKFTESVNEQSFQQALTYDYLYQQSQQLTPDAIQTYVVSAQTPRPTNLQTWGYQVSEHSGVYISPLPLLKRVVLLVLNELRDERHNEFLRLFASRQQVRKQALHVLFDQPVDQWPTPFWAVLLGLEQVYKLEGADMDMGLTVEQVLDVGETVRKKILASASLEERLSGLAPAERLSGLAPAERLSGLAPAERLSGLAPAERLSGLAPAERLSGLAPEELRSVMKQIETILGYQASRSTSAEEAKLIGQRQMLIHVLRHKFGEFPLPILRKIEATTDSTQLNQWLDQALDAQSLDPSDFDQRAVISNQ